MKSYFVSWDIELDADSPRDAAQQAFDLIRSPNTFATVFKVTDEDGETESIDLLEDE